jgi:hypothetical protein
MLSKSRGGTHYNVGKYEPKSTSDRLHYRLQTVTRAVTNALIQEPVSKIRANWHNSRFGIYQLSTFSYPQFLTANTSLAGLRSPLQLIRRGASKNRSLNPSFSYNATIRSVA